MKTLFKINESNNGLLLEPHYDGPLLINGSVNPQFSSLSLVNYAIKSKIDVDCNFYPKTNKILKLINITHSINGVSVLLGKEV